MDEKTRIIDGVAHELIGKCDSDKCGAFCCSYLLFKVPVVRNDDSDYFRLHGCSIVQRGDSLLVLVPKSCEFLDKKKLQCTVYDDRPAICRLYAKRESDAFKSEFCGLSWKPVRGRGAQIILSKMRG